MKRLTDSLFVGLQYLLPRHALTALVYRLARVRTRWVRDALIRGFTRLFGVDLEEVDGRVPEDFATFNEFFVRPLKPGARQVDPGAATLVSPVDGTVSEAGRIEQGRLYQAKGYNYTLEDLLASDTPEAGSYLDGNFATIYLAPYNYHRVHAPMAGRLVAARYVPGDLFSVNRTTVGRVPNLFARNERLVCHFQTDSGPLAVLLVGALNVGSITTPWTGEIRPRKRGVVEEIDISHAPVDRRVAKGDLLGWFNMGSTVILLMPRGACSLRADLAAGDRLRMGETIATVNQLSP